MVRIPQAVEFNDLELYLMGLIPADQVGRHFVFRDQDQLDQLTHEGILRGPVDFVDIDDIVAMEGPRIPAVGDSQTSFNMATIVLSDGGLLSAEDMAFFFSEYREGTATAESPVISSDVNYLFFSPDQIEALNGRIVGGDGEEETPLLDPRYGWGVFVTDGDPDDDIGGGLPNTGVKHVAVVVKWTDPGRNRVDFTVLESFVAEVAPRM